MAERKLADVKWDIERCTCHVPDACSDCSHKVERADFPVCMENLMLEAYELLKKQTPKYRNRDTVGNFVCPNKGCTHRLYPQQRYCDVCGQAVKWE